MRMLLPALVAWLASALASAAPASALAAEDTVGFPCNSRMYADEVKQGVVGLPRGDLFCMLVADPKAIRTFVTYLAGRFPTNSGTISVGSVGVGVGWPFFRLNGERVGDGLQLGIDGAVFSQFQIETNTHDLLNADYLVGFPLTFRRDRFSARLRVYHQSSHLGDKLLTRPENTIRRQDVAFEAVEAIGSYEATIGPHELAFLRVYGGGEILFDRAPRNLGQTLLHTGLEARREVKPGARLVAALDLKVGEQDRWTPAWSVRAGVEFAFSRKPGDPLRVWSILGEFYDGPSPYGQFFLQSTRFGGFGFQLQL